MNQKIIAPLLVLIISASVVFLFIYDSNSNSDTTIKTPVFLEKEIESKSLQEHDSFLIKLENTNGYEEERSIVLEFVQSYKDTSSSQNTLEETLVVFFSNATLENPDLKITEKYSIQETEKDV